MNSVFLTRRAMLSGGTLLGLGALLAACGQQATNEAAATASTAPSESASASAAVSDAASASATPSPVITRGYLEARRHPTANTAKLMVTALRRMFLCRKPSRSSTPKPSLDSVR